MPIPETKQGPAAPPSYNPPGYRSRPLHIALIVTDLLARLHPLILTPLWLALAALAGWPWARADLAPAVIALSLALTVADGAGLLLLPRLGRSFGSPTPPLLGLALVRTAITLTTGLLWSTGTALLLAGALHLAILAIAFYATWVEPFRLGVTHAALHSPKLAGNPPLRLLHISDLHVEHPTAREEAVIRRAGELQPDLVVLTGDYLNLSYVYNEQTHAETRNLLARLCTAVQAPVYAVTGSPPVDRADVVPAIFADLPITWLVDTVHTIQVNGHTLRLAGLRCSRERAQDAPHLNRLLAGRTNATFTLLLYHSPDLMPEAAALGVDLYLCGHTHGGQIRLPLFGALVTSSDFWKRYEMGRYEEKGTTLYVCRGLGMEGMGAPRARFLSPP